jgi:hypothetical protein
VAANVRQRHSGAGTLLHLRYDDGWECARHGDADVDVIADADEHTRGDQYTHQYADPHANADQYQHADPDRDGDAPGPDDRRQPR